MAAIYVEWENQMELAFKQKLVPEKAQKYVTNISTHQMVEWLTLPDNKFGDNPTEGRDSFIFSTELRYISDFIKQKGLENTLKLLSEKADNWSSGTKIGLCLKDFNEKYAKTMLSRSSFVIILSDGLDTGDKGIIEVEMQAIRRRTKRLIWLNPLKNMQGYAPTARGMSEAFPHINVFESGHSVHSLLELEKFLINV
jgi:uncharacterized protein